jgi:hypothetical protein
MGMYGMCELPAPVRATVDTCHDSCADLGDSFIDESQRPEGRRERVPIETAQQSGLGGVL